MNIRICPLQNVVLPGSIVCSTCGSTHYRGHGSYSRKGFHLRGHMVTIPLKVPRFLCLNSECPRVSFSILPSQTMRYSRFFWPCLLALIDALSAGSSIYHQARQVWHVGWAVIRRASKLLQRLSPWIESLHRELTNGMPPRELGFMVKILIAKLGPLELTQRWYRHRYPKRFSDKISHHTIWL